MYQYNHHGRRWYYLDGKWYISVTEFVKNSLPTPIHLQQWYKDNSAEFIDNTLKETSDYGTRLHAHIEELLRSGSVDISSLEDRMQLHMASIAQFLVDMDVKPIAIEERIYWDADTDFPMNFAGTVDLIAQTNKGPAIIDFKSGNIQDSHRYQMMCYALAYSQKTGDRKWADAAMINVRPKEWRSASPTYEAKTWRIRNEDWLKLSAMCTIYEFDIPPKRRIFGNLTLGEEPSYQTMEAEEWINQQISGIDFVS